jgi:prephenate dehydrogenase
MALKQRGLAAHVAAYVRRETSIAECLSAGAADSASCSLEENVAGADLVVLCTPIGQMRALFQRLIGGLGKGALVTDVGSVKRAVVTPLERMARKAGIDFIGSHPMAGSEKTGVKAAKADLFEGAICVVTPTRNTTATALEHIETLWRSVGSRVLRLTPGAHDRLVSRSSHLPHLLAAQLTHFVLDPALPQEQGRLCANGFRDVTRIASGSPDMWCDIAIANGDYLCEAVETFAKRLKSVCRAIRKRDSEKLAKFFGEAKLRRDEWTLRPRISSPE